VAALVSELHLRCLHLFANYKWTGPADPAIRCAARLRSLGADVVFARAGWTLPRAEHRMELELARAGVPVVAGLELRKHFHLSSVLRDRAALAARLVRGEFDLLHCHLSADHLIAALAKRRARRRARRRILLVRSLYDSEAPRPTVRARIAFRETDAIVVPTEAVAARAAAAFHLPRRAVLVQEPPTEPSSLRACGDLRARLGVDSSHFVVGITARIQPHRRFDLLWDVARRVVDAEPACRFVLLGRGNAEDTRTLVEAPIERLGLTGHVMRPGYLQEPDYSLALRSLDLFLFLVPGSDGTCRAVREAMSFGVPVVATARGMLPHLLAPVPELGIADAPGIVADERVDALAGAILALLRDERRRVACARAALAKARQAMDPERAARRLLSLYAGLAEEPP
jgi:glycosyltransferase involved in cell wall biosynthesis